MVDHQVVGVVFVDFKKAFDSISHSVLLHKITRSWNFREPLVLDCRLSN